MHTVYVQFMRTAFALVFLINAHLNVSAHCYHVLLDLDHFAISGVCALKARMHTSSNLWAKTLRTYQSQWLIGINATCVYSCCLHLGSSAQIFSIVVMKSSEVCIDLYIIHVATYTVYM